MSDGVRNSSPSQTARLTDPAWLVHAESEEVLSRLSDASKPDGVLAAAVYRASMRLHSKYLPVVRRDLLALDAARYGDRELADRLASTPVKSPGSLWKVAWSTGSQVDPRLRFVSDDVGNPNKLAVVVRDSRLLIITDWSDENVCVSDPVTGDTTLEPLADYRTALDVQAVTTFEPRSTDELMP